jgi:SAM-dependent methyltransferase
MTRRELASLVGKYAPEKNPGGPAGESYFWHRKRLMMLDLIAANAGSRGTEAQPAVYVDLGSGEGIDLSIVADFLGAGASPENPLHGKWKCIGVEGFPQHIEDCRKRLASFGLGQVEVLAANITKPLGFADASIDMLLCSEVFEHMPDPGVLVREIHRVLKTGGLALITTPNEPNPLQRSWWSAKRREQVRERFRGLVHSGGVEINGELVDIYGHISLQTSRELDALMAKFGFDRQDYRRGAMFYGGQRWLNLPPIHFARLMVERLLDLAPLSLVRNISDESIALYRKSG